MKLLEITPLEGVGTLTLKPIDLDDLLEGARRMSAPSAEVASGLKNRLSYCL